MLKKKFILSVSATLLLSTSYAASRANLTDDSPEFERPSGAGYEIRSVNSLVWKAYKDIFTKIDDLKKRHSSNADIINLTDRLSRFFHLCIEESRFFRTESKNLIESFINLVDAEAPLKGSFLRHEKRRIVKEQEPLKKTILKDLKSHLVTLIEDTTYLCDHMCKSICAETHLQIEAGNHQGYKTAFLKGPHPAYLTMKEIIEGLLDFVSSDSTEAKSILDSTTYGKNKDFQICWMIDDKGNRLYLPFSKAHSQSKYYYKKLSFGEFNSLNLRSILFDNGEFVTQKGILLCNNTYRKTFTVRELNVNFDEAPFKGNLEFIQLEYNSLIVQKAISTLGFLPSSDKTVCFLFIPLPETETEKEELELALLDYLAEEGLQDSSNILAQSLLKIELPPVELPDEDIATTSSTEAETASAMATTEASSPTAATPSIQNYIDARYEDLIRKEQEEIARKVASGEIEAPKQSKKTKKIKAVAATTSEAEVDDALIQRQLAEAKRQAINEAKAKGRAKWRDTIQLINNVLKNETIGNLGIEGHLNTNAGGSHFRLELRNTQNGETSTLPIARPHGGTEISVGERNTIIETLMSRVFDILRMPSQPNL